MIILEVILGLIIFYIFANILYYLIKYQPFITVNYNKGQWCIRLWYTKYYYDGSIKRLYIDLI